MEPLYYPPNPVPPIQGPGKLNSFLRWVGRVTLWLVFWPIGLWRSARNRGAKRHRELVNSVRANPSGPVVVRMPADRLEVPPVRMVAGNLRVPWYPPPPPPPPLLAPEHYAWCARFNDMPGYCNCPVGRA